MNREKKGRISKFQNFMRQYWSELGGASREEMDKDYIQEQNRQWWERQHPDEMSFYNPNRGRK
jgi:hypothetical protein